MQIPINPKDIIVTSQIVWEKSKVKEHFDVRDGILHIYPKNICDCVDIFGERQLVFEVPNGFIQCTIRNLGKVKMYTFYDEPYYLDYRAEEFDKEE